MINFNNNIQMQNQLMNFNEFKIEELIKPFQEKIKKLEEEITQKDLEITRLKIKLFQKNEINQNLKFSKEQINPVNNPMNQMNNPMSQMMNNPMNKMMNNPMNKMMNNPMNQMNNPMNQMNNPMNQMNNPMNQMNNPMNLMNNPMNQMNNQMQMNQMMNQMMMMMQMDGNIEKRGENLIVIFQIENSQKIKVQCNSHDTMEKAINSFSCKANFERQSYEFFIKKKTSNNITIEDNGINMENNIICVEKIKINDGLVEKDNISKPINKNNLEKKILPEKQMNKKNDEIIILGEIINIFFNASSGLKILISLGKNNTVKQAISKFCEKIGLPESIVDREIMFFYNGGKLDIYNEKSLGELFKNSNYANVTVIDQYNVYGA